MGINSELPTTPAAASEQGEVSKICEVVRPIIKERKKHHEKVEELPIACFRDRHPLGIFFSACLREASPKRKEWVGTPS